MIRKLAEDLKVGDSFGQEMAKILADPKHQKLFKNAETVCNCSKECDCSGDKCSCKGSCINTCKSCGKEKTIEAAWSVINDLSEVSETLDKHGFEKQSEYLLKLASFYTKKLANKDSNDIKMDELGANYGDVKYDLADEIDELESSKEYMEWAKNPDFYAFNQKEKNLDNLTKDISIDFPEPEKEFIFNHKLPSYLSKKIDIDFLEGENSEEDSFSANDQSLEMDDDLDTKIYYEPEKTLKSPEYHDTEIDTPIFEGELDLSPLDKGLNANLLDEDKDIDYFNIKKRRIPENKVPKFDEDTLLWAFQKADKYFYKLAKYDEIEENEEEESFEDE